MSIPRRSLKKLVQQPNDAIPQPIDVTLTQVYDHLNIIRIKLNDYFDIIELHKGQKWKKISVDVFAFVSKNDESNILNNYRNKDTSTFWAIQVIRSSKKKKTAETQNTTANLLISFQNCSDDSALDLNTDDMDVDAILKLINDNIDNNTDNYRITKYIYCDTIFNFSVYPEITEPLNNYPN